MPGITIILNTAVYSHLENHVMFVLVMILCYQLIKGLQSVVIIFHFRNYFHCCYWFFE